MFLYKSGPGGNFDQLAKIHFDQLKGIRIFKNGGSGHYAFSIIKKIDNNSKARRIGREFFMDLQRDNYKLALEIISGKPKRLAEIVESINQNIASSRYPEIFRISRKGVSLTKFGQKVESTFDYGTFSNKNTPNWNAYLLADLVGINVCPYCNRGYTFTAKNTNEKIVRPEFDHFYSREKHPYLSLSFYNLIPSCHICNSNLKHKVEFSVDTHLHPYEESLDELVRFSVRLKKKNTGSLVDEKKSFGESFFYGDLGSFDLVLRAAKRGINRKTLKRAMRSVRTFRIRELYQKHKDMVIDMILNTIVYDDSQLNSLLNNYGNLFRDRNDVLRHITKNYVGLSEMPNRTFSKLAKDIHTEFGLIY
ncbi:MAG TPA: hypothetical protein VGQ59_07880 [Cyclobacteriaceae bacterium]|jgi:hypothetical protein|nr:hypothetical protein [Cyclobacteriaceae bacterium]